MVTQYSSAAGFKIYIAPVTILLSKRIGRADALVSLVLSSLVPGIRICDHFLSPLAEIKPLRQNKCLYLSIHYGYSIVKK